MDEFFWTDFIDGVYFAFATLIFLFLYVCVVLYIQTKFKFDDVWCWLVACLLLPFFAILAFPLFPDVRSLGIPTPTVVYGSRGATVMPDLSTIPFGSIIGIFLTVKGFFLIISVIAKIKSKYANLLHRPLS